jgi:hypothetical protein
MRKLHFSTNLHDVMPDYLSIFNTSYDISIIINQELTIPLMQTDYMSAYIKQQLSKEFKLTEYGKYTTYPFIIRNR